MKKTTKNVQLKKKVCLEAKGGRSRRNGKILSCRDLSISECESPDSAFLILDTSEMLKLAAVLPWALSAVSGERGMTEGQLSPPRVSTAS